MNLFKFKSAENIENFNRDINTITNNQIWFSGLESLNDPFEKVYATEILDKSDNNEEVVKYLCIPVKKNIDEFFKKVGILSLCRRKTNLVMWSHYSNNHKGYCIEYNLNQNELNSLNFEANDELFLFGVEYENKPIDYLSLPSKCQFYLRRKSKLWKYENEFRFISSKKGLHNVPENSITAIYLGADANEIVKNTLKNLCLDKKIKLYETILSENTYKLKFKRIL